MIFGIAVKFLYSTLIDGLQQKMQPGWLIFFISLILVNLPMELVAMKSSRDKYNRTTGVLNLNQRFNLSISYEMTRCFVFGTVFNILIQIFLVLLGWLILVDKLSWTMVDYRIINQITFAFEMSIFPWILLFCHRQWRDKTWKRINPWISGRKTSIVTNLKGQTIVTNPTQHDYFEQLDAAWRGGPVTIV